MLRKCLSASSKSLFNSIVSAIAWTNTFRLEWAANSVIKILSNNSSEKKENFVHPELSKSKIA